jgi:hypothetical protein
VFGADSEILVCPNHDPGVHDAGSTPRGLPLSVLVPEQCQKSLDGAELKCQNHFLSVLIFLSYSRIEKIRSHLLAI